MNADTLRNRITSTNNVTALAHTQYVSGSEPINQPHILIILQETKHTHTQLVCKLESFQDIQPAPIVHGC